MTTDPDALTRKAERRTNTPVGPYGNLPGEDPEWPTYGAAEVAQAEADLRGIWELMAEQARQTASKGQMGLPATRGRAYYAARHDLLMLLLHPRPTPGGDRVLDLAGNTARVIPDSDTAAMSVAYRCRRCGCNVAVSHTPGSEACDEARHAREDSQRDD